MNKNIITLKDFELSPKENIIERSQNFQAYIDQMKTFGCKGYWVMSKTGVGAKMEIEGYDGMVSAYTDKVTSSSSTSFFLELSCDAITVLTRWPCLWQLWLDGKDVELPGQTSNASYRNFLGL